jgi:hypothetical protein
MGLLLGWSSCQGVGFKDAPRSGAYPISNTTPPPRARTACNTPSSFPNLASIASEKPRSMSVLDEGTLWMIVRTTSSARRVKETKA